MPLVEEGSLEHKLAAADPARRKHEGVYYTPASVVDFLNRSVASVLHDQFSDQQITVVDPSCGDGRFLVEASRYVQRPAHFVGMDIMPEAVEVARQNLNESHESAAHSHLVRCLNPLTAVDDSQRLLSSPSTLAVIGNPPYSNFGKQRPIDGRLKQWMSQYSDGLAERKVNLTDLYIRFMAWAHYQIEQVGRGLLAYVTNHTYLSGPTYRGLRASLLRSFDQIHIVDMHGNKSRRERPPHGDIDENLFPIRMGVCLTIAIKSSRLQRTVRHTDLWGTREHKLAQLSGCDVAGLSLKSIKPNGPAYIFCPTGKCTTEYADGWKLDDVFTRFVSGVQTKRDAVFVARSKDELRQQVERLFQDPSDHPAWLQERVQGRRFSEPFIRPYLVAPFDQRWIYYDPKLIGRARFSVLQSMTEDNIALIFMRQSTNPGTYDHFLCTRVLASDRCFYSAQGAPFIAPLFVNGNSNLNGLFCRELGSRLNRPQVDPSDVFAYVVGVTHQDEYRCENQSSLRQDFPRVPLPQDADTFVTMVATGRQVIQLQCDLARLDTSALNAREDPSSRHRSVRNRFPDFAGNVLYINENQRLDGVHSAAWETTIGGYRVLYRWLRQRRGSLLNDNEVDYVREMCARLCKLQALA